MGDRVKGGRGPRFRVRPPAGKKYKKDVYESCGVREYWIVSPGEKTVEQYLLEKGEFTLHEVYTVFPDWMLEKMTAEERASVIIHFKCSLYDDLDISPYFQPNPIKSFPSSRLAGREAHFFTAQFPPSGRPR